MQYTKVAPASATQKPFPPSAGFVQALPDIPTIWCGGCKIKFWHGTRVCPACGWKRPAMEAEPYPDQRVERFAWVFAQRIGPRRGHAKKHAGTPAAKMVLMALVAHDMPGGRGIFPSIDRLAEMTELDRATVIRALAHLRKAGWVTRRKVRRRGGQGSNEYTIQQPECIVAAMSGDDSPPFPESHSATLAESHCATLRAND